MEWVYIIFDISDISLPLIPLLVRNLNHNSEPLDQPLYATCLVLKHIVTLGTGILISSWQETVEKFLPKFVISLVQEQT